jgi:hypothetical protein
MEATCSSETSDDYQRTKRRYITKDSLDVDDFDKCVARKTIDEFHATLKLLLAVEVGRACSTNGGDEEFV